MLCRGGAVAVQSWFCLAPPPPGCTMKCNSTQHIQKFRHPTPDHARIGTVLSSNTEWGKTNLHITGAALPCVCNVPQGRSCFHGLKGGLQGGGGTTRGP